MPLKHSTETLLVFLLGFCIALAGAASSLLPSVSIAPLPWAILFFLSVVYPLALYPMLRDRRADYEFRALHFVPALVLMVWLLLDLLSGYSHIVRPVLRGYSWGFALPTVLLAFFLIAAFCLRVVRQQTQRLLLLSSLLVPFLVLSQLSEWYAWDQQVASLFLPPSSGVVVIAEGNASSNLTPSSHADEERWRMQLRKMERRRQRIEQHEDDPFVAQAAIQGVIVAVQNSEGSHALPPPRLPSSGSEAAGILLMGLVAGYCSVLHRQLISRFA